MQGKVLIVDDDQSIRQSIELLLGREGLDARAAHDGFHALDVLKVWTPDLCIVDVKMPGMTGLELLDSLRRTHPTLPVIIITAYDEMEYTIEAIQRGAYDFLEKPIDILKLKAVVGGALDHQKLSLRTDGMHAVPAAEHVTATIIGATPPMKQIYKQIGQVSNSRITVLLQGESGTGKELIARVVHSCGVTKGAPFVAVNCAVLAEGLIESELFGHEKGSFTSADREKKGKFELAANGTIFLDEIADISPGFQAKLLRVLQEREYEHVGGEIPLQFNARVIAATNKDLWQLVRDGAFREDLFYRLSVFRIDVPPLRERRDDIPKLVMHFLRKINSDLKKNVYKVPYEVVELLQAGLWQGNVRELENTLLQAVIRSKGEVLEVNMDDGRIATHAPRASVGAQEHLLSLDDVEKRHIALVLAHTKWDKQAACAILGISKPTLSSKIRIYGLAPMR